MGKHLTYFVSDVHLGLDVKNPEDREARFVSFLRSIDPAETSALYLLGDIWDFWYEWKNVVPKGYVRVFGTLADLMDAGVDVYFFRGNHDIWTYSYFEELGMKRLEQPCTVTIGKRTFCLGHGDGLGPVPKGYMFLRWMFHNRVLQFLFSRLSTRLVFALGRGWSRKSRLSHGRQYVFRGEDEPLCKFAKEYMKKEKVDIFIFGHYHSPIDIPVVADDGSKARMLILGDWIEHSPYIVYEHLADEFKIC